MSTAANISRAIWQPHNETEAGAAVEIWRGLASPRKSIPSKFLYDERGAKLFDQITELEEYYPTRTETAIMRENAQEMARHIGANATLIELGSGSAVKTRLLLNQLESLSAYVPVDISREQLEHTATQLQREYPSLRVLPVWADYITDRFIAPVSGRMKRVFYFPGSTIGNFRPFEAHRFLMQLAAHAGDDGQLLIGVDLQKDTDVLERAYNDESGVTAAFNLNLLRVVNRELSTNFKIWKFFHRAIYNQREGCIEMHLVSRSAHEVAMPDGRRFHFLRGEPIHTEWSYKYRLDRFESLARSAGWQLQQVWTDPSQWFSVQLLRVAR